MRKLLKHPKIMIAVCLVLTLFFGLQLRGLSISNSIRQYMPQDDQSYIRLIQTEDEFGSMVIAGIALETDGPTILTAKNISIIDNVTKKIENLDYVEDIQSLTNIDYVEAVDGALVASSLLGDNFQGTDAEITAINEKINSWSELYNRVIVSDDMRATQIMVTLKKGCSSEAQEATLTSIRQILSEELKDSGLAMRIFGDPVLSEQSKAFMLSDLTGLIPLVVVVVLLSLLFSFGTLDGTILPLLTVLMSTVWSVGLMALLGESFSIVSSIIPVALIAVGSAYGIHVLTHYYVALDNHKGEKIDKERHIDIIIEGLKDVKDAVILAAITTIAGFLSLITSPIVPLHSFAIYTALGVFIALLLSVFMIPCILVMKKEDRIGKRSHYFEDKAKELEAKAAAAAAKGNLVHVKVQGEGLYGIYKAVAGTRTRAFVFIVVLICVSIIGINKLVINTSLVNYFPASSEFRKDIAYVDETFAGTNSVYVTVESTGDKDVTNPEVLKAIDDMSIYLDDSFSDIGKVVSFPTFLKRMNQVMHQPVVEKAAEVVEEPEVEEATTSTETLDSFDSFGSFGDTTSTDPTASFGSFGDETSQKSTDDSAAFGSFGDSSSFGSFGDSTAEVAADAGDTYVDPNIAYAKTLGSAITAEQAFDLLNTAYLAAGGKNASVEDVVNELEKTLNYQGMAYYEVPYDPAKYPVASRDELANLVSQYLLLFSGSLDQFNNDPLAPTKTRIQVQLRSHNTKSTNAIIDAVNKYADAHFPEGYKVAVTGSGEMESAMTDLVVNSQMTSLLLSLAMVIIILSVSFKSLIAGLLGAVPLALTILLNFMMMAFIGINLDLVTSIIASVAIGVGIDYTIHFMETFKGEHLKNPDLDAATRETFRKSGHGIITNAIAVGLGFLVLSLSRFEVLRYIGILIAIVMFTSSMLAMTIIPAFLNIFDPKFAGGKKKEKKSK